MRRKDIKEGDVLAWARYASNDMRYTDGISIPVRVVDLAREVPTYSGRAFGRDRVQTGTKKVIMVARLLADLSTPNGDEFEVATRNLTGLWYDRVERVVAREKADAEEEARKESRRNATEAVHNLVGELSDPELPRGVRWDGDIVKIRVTDLLALVKAARTAALNELEGTGGRDV